MRSLFSKVWSGLVATKKYMWRIFTPPTDTVVEKVLLELAPYVEEALPIVEQIAKMTPNRADDEIVAVAKLYSAKFHFDPATPMAQRGEVLRALAMDAMRNLFGSFPSTSLLNRAIELALGIAQKQ